MKTLFYILVTFLFISCSDPFKPFEPKVYNLTDPQFNGKFIFYGDGTFYSSYHFNGTNKVAHFQNSYHYIYASKYNIVECEIKNDMIRFRSWGLSEWTNLSIHEWMPYYFENGDLYIKLSSILTSYTKYKKE